MKVWLNYINWFWSTFGKMNSVSLFSSPLINISLLSYLFRFLVLCFWSILIYIMIHIVITVCIIRATMIWLLLALFIRLNSLLKCSVFGLWGWVLLIPLKVILAWFLFNITLLLFAWMIGFIVSNTSLKLAISSQQFYLFKRFIRWN